jgi:hypothetical protein
MKGGGYMSGIGWLVIAVIGGAGLILGLALCMVAGDSAERENLWCHPPDNDDGISLLTDEEKDDAEQTESH